MKEEEALVNLGNLFPSLDKLFLEDVFASSNKDFDKTVDQLLAMGVELSSLDGKKKQVTPPPVHAAPPQHQYELPKPHIEPTKPQPQYPAYPQITSPTPVHNPNPIVQTPNPPLVPPVPPLTGQVAYSVPTMPNMFNVPATPPPINTSNINKPAATSPTAPPAKPADGSVEQKRLETLKQELALEYQRINDTHKYNLEVQQKLEQLREYTTAEQRKLDEQRNNFMDEKRRLAEDLAARHKAMQDEFARMKEELQVQTDQKIAAMEAEAEAAKEAQRVLKLEEQSANMQQLAEKDAEERARFEVVEVEKQEMLRRIEEEQIILRQHYEEQIQERTMETEKLREVNEQLKFQLSKAANEKHTFLLDFLSSVTTAVAETVHVVPTVPLVGDNEEEKSNQFQKNLLLMLASSLNKRANEN